MSNEINFVKSGVTDMLKIKIWTGGYLINSFTGFCIVIQVALRFVIIAHCKRVVTANEDLSRIDARGGTGQFIGFMAVMILA